MVTRTLLPPAVEAAEPSYHQPAEQSAGRLGAGLFSRRSLRWALGLVWLLDGALQLQSFMFTKGFATSIIAPSAAGQPGFVAGAVGWNARLIAGHPALFNGVFASVQLALGLAFLFRRTARLAVVASVAWAAGVWYFGEGLGEVFGWHTTALAGAPGAALLYAVLALAAWPGSGPAGSDHEARRRELLPGWTLGVWAILWVGSGGVERPAGQRLVGSHRRSADQRCVHRAVVAGGHRPGPGFGGAWSRASGHGGHRGGRAGHRHPGLQARADEDCGSVGRHGGGPGLLGRRSELRPALQRSGH